MARETKLERQLREANERAAYDAEQQATYLPRLMKTMQRAQAVNFELDVRDMSFYLRDRDDRDFDVFVLDLEYSADNNETLETLAREVEWKEEREAEANRKVLARSVALAKLTTEERALLNVS